MAEKKEKQTLSIGLESGHIEITTDDAIKLYRLSQHEGMPVLRDILKAMNEGCTVGLRDKAKGIDDLRYLQGMSASVGRIADIVLKEIPEWYTTPVAEGSDPE